jgi:Sugar kinases, ribokinase family
MKRIACIGDNCIDCYDETGERYPGGNPVNVSVYFRRLGTPSSYIGAVGNDEDGRLIIESLRDKGVDTSHVKVLEGNTAITHVQRIDGERVFKDSDDGVTSQLSLTEEDIAFIAEHDLAVTGLWGYTEPFLPILKKRGIPIAYDASDHLFLPQCREGMKYADYLFFSDDSASEDLLQKKMQEIAAMGTKAVVAMRGSRGSLAFANGQLKSCGIISCDVVDTMGAGDSYIAGFLNALLEGADLSECMRKGAENAAFTIGYNGAW